MLFSLTFALLGLLFGSFGSVLVTRLPEGRSVAGRSRCPHCNVVLRAMSLIPVLSFCTQRGRCAACAARISWMYPLLEVGSALLFVVATVLATTLPEALLLAGVFWVLFLIAVVDAWTGVIPDSLNALLVVLGILVVFLRSSLDLFALILGVGFLGAQWLLSGGRWIGSGDVLLMVGLGLVLPSWMHLALALALAYVSGACVAILLLVAGRTHLSARIPFGPFLAIGGGVTMVFGEKIMDLVLMG